MQFKCTNGNKPNISALDTVNLKESKAKETNVHQRCDQRLKWYLCVYVCMFVCVCVLRETDRMMMILFESVCVCVVVWHVFIR